MPAARYAKPEILAAIPLDRHTVIEASAGTGKTYTLEHLILELLLTTDATIDQILVVTFTEKATSELRARVRRKIESLVTMIDEAAREPAAPAPAPGGRSWLLDEAARHRLTRALHSFDGATISTIHGFCQRVLTEHAFANHRLLEQAQVNGSESFARAFREELREELARDQEPRRYLEAALRAGYSVERIERELGRVATLRGELRPAFDPAALARTLADFPVEEMVGPGLAAALKATGLHPSQVRALLDRLAMLADLVAGARGRGDPARLLADLELAERARGGELLGYLREDLAALPPRVHAAVVALDHDAVPLLAALVHRLLPQVLRRVKRRKHEAGHFDFDDMLLLLRDSLAGPHGAALRDLLRARYRYALIDEFQDTDEVQWDIFRTVFFESDGANLLYVIGDPKQAIYGFRGADVHTYEEARRLIVDGGGPSVALATCFRATAPLIDAYNRILDQAGDPPFFGGPTIRYDHPVAWGDGGLRALDRDGAIARPVHLLEVAAPGGSSADAVTRALGARIGREIPRLLDPARPLILLEKDGRPRPIEARDIFLLTRTEREGKALGETLRAAGVAHAYYKQDGLLAGAEAERLRDLLAAVAAPHDPAARLRAWLTPFFGLTLADARSLRELPDGHPLLGRLLDWHALAERRAFAELFPRILAESGLVRRALFLGESERALTNYLHLFELVAEEAARSATPLADLVLRLGAYRDGTRRPPGEDGDVERLESDRQAVQILTMHKAKGLQAAVVFVVGGFGSRPAGDSLVRYHDGTAPVVHMGRRMPRDQAEKAAAEALAEDERLLYVALTRARARLYLPLFQPVGDDGEKRFLPQGAYARVNDRLRALAPLLDQPALAALFSREVVPCPPVEAEEAEPPAGRLAGWRPPRPLLDERDDHADFSALAARRRGFLVTSYSQMRAEQGDDRARRGPRSGEGAPSRAGRGGGRSGSPVAPARRRAPARRDGGADEDRPLDDEVVPGGAPARRDVAPSHGGDEGDRLRGDAPSGEALTDDAGLPGGIAVGVFLHAVIEKVPFASLDGGDGDSWRARSDVRALLASEARRNGVDARHLDEAARLVHRALTCEVALGGGARIAGLAAARESAREMEFLYPLPERSHPRLSAPPGARSGTLTVERGFIKGFIDYLFEHDGRTYVVDWKSDLLHRYNPATMTRHVDDHYLLQAKLYSIALVKMLRVHDAAAYEARFGALLYCFLRGMGGPVSPGDHESLTPGVYLRRPAWAEILDWEEELVA